MKFGQNKSCRGREDLQLLFWAKVNSRLGLGRKTRTNTARTMLTIRLVLASFHRVHVISALIPEPCRTPAPAPRRRAASGRPNPHRAHHEVARDLLYLLPHFPLAAGEPPRRNPASKRHPPLFSRPGTPDSNRNNFRGFSAKSVTQINSVALDLFEILAANFGKS